MRKLEIYLGVIGAIIATMVAGFLLLAILALSQELIKEMAKTCEGFLC